jgi:hypothetical protein
MARTSRNSHGSLKSIRICDEETTVRYIDNFADTMDSAPAANGAYSKAVNNGGWTNPAGPFGLNNQGLIKSAVWSIAILSSRSKNGDEEAREIMTYIESIIHGAQERKLNPSPVSAVVTTSQTAEAV